MESIERIKQVLTKFVVRYPKDFSGNLVGLIV